MTLDQKVPGLNPVRGCFNVDICHAVVHNLFIKGFVVAEIVCETGIISSSGLLSVHDLSNK